MSEYVICTIQINGKAQLMLEMACYNKRVNFWEPLIETIISAGSADKRRPWQINFEVMKGFLLKIS